MSVYCYCVSALTLHGVGRSGLLLMICKIKVLMGLLKAEGASEKWNCLKRRETIWGQTLDLL